MGASIRSKAIAATLGAAVVVTGVAVVSSAHADTVQCEPVDLFTGRTIPGICIETDLGGLQSLWIQSIEDLNNVARNGGSWNDAITKVINNTDTGVCLYEHNFYHGASLPIAPGAQIAFADDWKYRATSIQPCPNSSSLNDYW